MSPKKFLYDIDGEITKILQQNKAEIEFEVDGNQEYAFLWKNRFFPKGKPIPDEDLLCDYLRVNMKVTFCCHQFDQHQENQDPSQLVYKWYATSCWERKAAAADDNSMTLTMGLFSVPCTIESMERHSGVLMMQHVDKDIRIEFMASRCYLEGKRFPGSKHLSQELIVGDLVFCDAIPCIEEESKYSCSWFATMAFRNLRPPETVYSINHLSKFEQKYLDQNSSDGSEDYSDAQQVLISPRIRLNWLQFINQYVRNARTVFVRGRGTVLSILDDEFGILLGCLSKNVFETILFHRKQAFLFKSSLGISKLTEIFEEGDEMRFIAAAAPPKFITKWIAIQVAVADFTSNSNY